MNIQFSDHNTDGLNYDQFAPTPDGRESGTGSPSSLEAAMVAPNYNTCGSNGATNCTDGEDSTKSFPFVLHSIVSNKNSDDAIHWLPCGTRFAIVDKDDFSKIILPHYFGGRGGSGSSTKFTSFTRRLKRWKFSRVPSGREMGAYYHENFRRGEPELAKSIVYPVIKSPPGAKKPIVPKARRRASTGSLLPVKFDAAAFDITPMPIRGPVMAIEDGAILPLPELENDMKNWLSSADFTDTLSIDAEPVSVVSNSSSLHPPAPFPSSIMSGGPPFPSSVMSGGSQLGEPMVMRRPGTMMRRHSTTMGNLSAPPTFMPMTTNYSNGANNSFSLSQLLETNFSCVPEMAVSSTNNMSFASNDMPTTVKTHDTPPPHPQHTGSSGGVDMKDPFSFSGGFSFDDLNMADPFT
eukprot:CAMPEP_0172312646 /NCGR_PEP_ID=MMETSP1058-20130122/18233_1 /TAXON_ID=83371 /ORGANISM="Detonula confervacea, Strain CCMP 353" /LENGTH=406 /DNA_ID=CAMNT_0013026169 /DNA_START=98 /DNA_END=1318 /DNA_ORIENTATION=+